MEENIQVLENKEDINMDNQMMPEVSSLFNQQETREKFNVIGLSLIAFIGLGCVVLSLLISFCPAFVDATKNLSCNLKLIIEYGLIYGIGFLLFYFVIRKLPKDNIPKEKFGFGRLIAIFTMTYPLTVAGNLAGNAIESVISPDNMLIDTADKLFSSSPIFETVISVAVAPIVEELVFRKMLIDRTKCYGEKMAIVFSAICFGLFHMDIPQFLYATCIGCIFGYVYSRSGKIHYTIIMHAVANGISVILTLLWDNQSSTVENEMTIGIAVGIAFVILEIVFTVMGIIFFFKRAIKVRFVETSPCCIPKKQRFRTIASSWGVILFIAICVGMTVFFYS